MLIHCPDAKFSLWADVTALVELVAEHCRPGTQGILSREAPLSGVPGDFPAGQLQFVRPLQSRAEPVVLAPIDNLSESLLFGMDGRLSVLVLRIIVVGRGFMPIVGCSAPLLSSSSSLSSSRAQVGNRDHDSPPKSGSVILLEQKGRSTRSSTSITLPNMV